MRKEFGTIDTENAPRRTHMRLSKDGALKLAATLISAASQSDIVVLHSATAQQHVPVSGIIGNDDASIPDGDEDMAQEQLEAGGEFRRWVVQVRCTFHSDIWTPGDGVIVFAGDKQDAREAAVEKMVGKYLRHQDLRTTWEVVGEPKEGGMLQATCPAATAHLCIKE
jgi:hypothetical protein